MQGVFQHVTGVKNAVSGYAGGEDETAHYRMVGSGRTGHAEAVRSPSTRARSATASILQIYFSVAHDPTQLNRQGPDVGTAVPLDDFPAGRRAGKGRGRLHRPARRGRSLSTTPIATTIEPGRAFYPAEDYHQDYLTLNPTQPYIVYNDLPKIENLKRLFPAVYRDDPVLVSEASLTN